MPKTVVRRVESEELMEVAYWLPSYAFQASPPLSDRAEREQSLRERQGVTYYALFEDGVAVACAAATPMIQCVRGELRPMAGIFDVATHPAARRRGYSRRVMAALLGSIREDGRSVSCLYPFRESFYQRMGYASFPQSFVAKLTPAMLAPVLDLGLDGAVELLPIVDGLEVYLGYVARLRKLTHGMAMFEYPDRSRAGRNTNWVALARVGGEIVGLMLYELRGQRVTEFTLRAWRFYYHTSLGRYLLLDWIARHVDQASQVEVVLPPFERPGTWLPDLKLALEPFFMPPMGRVVYVAALGGLAAGPGGFAARLSDPLCPWNEGIWRFESEGGRLRVAPAQTHDCDLSIQGLSALVYGVRDPADLAILGWGNPPPAVQATMRAMFPAAVPHLHEMF